MDGAKKEEGETAIKLVGIDFAATVTVYGEWRMSSDIIIMCRSFSLFWHPPGSAREGHHFSQTMDDGLFVRQSEGRSRHSGSTRKRSPSLPKTSSPRNPRGFA